MGKGRKLVNSYSSLTWLLSGARPGAAHGEKPAGIGAAEGTLGSVLPWWDPRWVVLPQLPKQLSQKGCPWRQVDFSHFG